MTNVFNRFIKGLQGKPLLKAAIIVFIFFACGYNAHAQDDKTIQQMMEKHPIDSLPYQKNPGLPAFNIMLLDSSTIFNTFNTPAGKPTAMLLFDPGCKHCQATIKRITEGMDSLKDIRFYVVSPIHDMSAIRKFSAEYHLADYKNIEVIGRDYEYFFFSFYGVRYVPDIALYDKNKKLITLLESNITVDALYRYTHP